MKSQHKIFQISGAATIEHFSGYFDPGSKPVIQCVAKEGEAIQFCDFSGREEYLAWVYNWRQVVARFNSLVKADKTVIGDQHWNNQVRSLMQSDREFCRKALHGLYTIRTMGKKIASLQRQKQNDLNPASV